MFPVQTSGKRRTGEVVALYRDGLPKFHTCPINRVSLYNSSVISPRWLYFHTHWCIEELFDVLGCFILSTSPFSLHPTYESVAKLSISIGKITILTCIKKLATEPSCTFYRCKTSWSTCLTLWAAQHCGIKAWCLKTILASNFLIGPLRLSLLHYYYD